jgi:hypothetical protein
VEYEFTLVTRPHRGCGQFVNVDAFLDERPEIVRYSASGEHYPSGLSVDMEMHDEVEYKVTPVSPAEFERILEAWRELSKLTISEVHSTQFTPAMGGSAFSLEVRDGGITSRFTWTAHHDDRTPFDRLVQCLREPQSRNGGPLGEST